MANYKVLEGRSTISDYDSFCLLVPQSRSHDILEALQAATNPCHEWELADQDISAELVPSIPAGCAHLLETIPETVPQDKCEGDLLNWLVSGGTLFEKQYLVLRFVDGKDGDDGYGGKIVIEIYKEQHLQLVKLAQDIAASSYEDGDSVFLDCVSTWDRATFLSKYCGKEADMISNGDMVKDFKELLQKKDDNYQEILGRCAWLTTPAQAYQHDLCEWSRDFVQSRHINNYYDHDGEDEDSDFPSDFEDEEEEEWAWDEDESSLEDDDYETDEKSTRDEADDSSGDEDMETED